MPWVATLRFNPSESRPRRWHLTVSREGLCALNEWYGDHPGPDVRAAALARAGFVQDGPWKWREHETTAGSGVWRMRARCFVRQAPPQPAAAAVYPCRTLEEQILGSYQRPLATLSGGPNDAA
jgi:hypothetical protein